jgi:hypothetical protein
MIYYNYSRVIVVIYLEAIETSLILDILDTFFVLYTIYLDLSEVYNLRKSYFFRPRYINTRPYAEVIRILRFMFRRLIKLPKI